MSPSATFIVIGLNLFGIAFHAILYAFVVGRKVGKIDIAVSDTEALKKKSDNYEGRISFLEGMMKARSRA